jgi:hypothetical protein
VTGARKHTRREERKYKRIFVRYGNPEPLHKAIAMQITPNGFFLATNNAVYATGSPIFIEVKGPTDTWVIQGIVRHAVKVPRSLAGFSRPGMGVEFVQPPDACRDFLAAL